MFAFERRVVQAMITTDRTQIRNEVEAFVDTSLAAMPEHLRAGIAGITLLIGSWSAARRLLGLGRSDQATLTWLESHPVGLVRQWARALRSLVLFAEQEKLEAAGVAA